MPTKNFNVFLSYHYIVQGGDDFDDFELKSTTSADTFRDGLKSFFLNDLAAEVNVTEHFAGTVSLINYSGLLLQ